MQSRRENGHGPSANVLEVWGIEPRHSAWKAPGIHCEINGVASIATIPLDRRINGFGGNCQLREPEGASAFWAADGLPGATAAGPADPNKREKSPETGPFSLEKTGFRAHESYLADLLGTASRRMKDETPPQTSDPGLRSEIQLLASVLTGSGRGAASAAVLSSMPGSLSAK